MLCPRGLSTTPQSRESTHRLSVKTPRVIKTIFMIDADSVIQTNICKLQLEGNIDILEEGTCLYFFQVKWLPGVEKPHIQYKSLNTFQIVACELCFNRFSCQFLLNICKLQSAFGYLCDIYRICTRLSISCLLIVD